MMNRKIACAAIAFACIMMLVHAVFPHHHHCHEVVFSAHCQWEQKAIENHDISSCLLSISSEDDHQCIPLPSHDDPCWKNTKYFLQPSLVLPASAASALLADLIPVSPDASIPLPPLSGKHEYSDYLLLPYQDIEHFGTGFRAPPFC